MCLQCIGFWRREPLTVSGPLKKPTAVILRLTSNNDSRISAPQNEERWDGNLMFPWGAPHRAQTVAGLLTIRTAAANARIAALMDKVSQAYRCPFARRARALQSALI